MSELPTTDSLAQRQRREFQTEGKHFLLDLEDNEDNDVSLNIIQLHSYLKQQVTFEELDIL